MEQQLTVSSKILNGFLSLMVVVLVGVILAVAISLVLYALGVF